MNAPQIHALLLKGTTRITLASFGQLELTDYVYDTGVFTVQPQLSARPPQQVSEEQFMEVYIRYLELDEPPISSDFALPSWEKVPQLLVSPYVGRLVHYFVSGE